MISEPLWVRSSGTGWPVLIHTVAHGAQLSKACFPLYLVVGSIRFFADFWTEGLRFLPAVSWWLPPGTCHVVAHRSQGNLQEGALPAAHIAALGSSVVFTQLPASWRLWCGLEGTYRSYLQEGRQPHGASHWEVVIVDHPPSRLPIHLDNTISQLLLQPDAA